MQYVAFWLQSLTSPNKCNIAAKLISQYHK